VYLAYALSTTISYVNRVALVRSELANKNNGNGGNMKGEIGIVKALLQYDAYMKYAPILRKIPNMDSQLKSIIISIGQYYEKYDEKSITVDSLREFYYYLNPQAADREMLEYFFTNISEMDVSDAVLGDLLNQVVERHACTEIAALATDVVNESVTTNIEKIQEKLDKYYEVTGKIEDIDEDLCDLDIDELFTEDINEGIMFRGKWFQDTFGLLPLGTLGHIFGRPDSGKSSLCLWQLTVMAKRIPPGRTGLYMNNEEGIVRIKRRGMQSLIDVSKEWVLENVGRAKKHWHESLCYERLKFIGSTADTSKIERAVKKYNPAIVVIDQGPKVLMPGRK
jgi:KaiC/GvpD/RAD55 family RecA-like ATPase